MSIGDCRELFLFAAKAGALEGYLYEKSKTAPLTNWVDNIDHMYQGLPNSVKNEINEVYVNVLQKILQYGQNEMDDLLKKKLKAMLSLATPAKASR
jgi:hypothetical protein